MWHILLLYLCSFVEIGIHLELYREMIETMFNKIGIICGIQADILFIVTCCFITEIVSYLLDLLLLYFQFNAATLNAFDFVLIGYVYQ